MSLNTVSPVALGLSVYQYHLQNVNHREVELYQAFQPAKIVGFIDLMPSRSPDSLASQLLGAPKGPGSQALGLFPAFLSGRGPVPWVRLVLLHGGRCTSWPFIDVKSKPS